MNKRGQNEKKSRYSLVLPLLSWVTNRNLTWVSWVLPKGLQDMPLPQSSLLKIIRGKTKQFCLPCVACPFTQYITNINRKVSRKIVILFSTTPFLPRDALVHSAVLRLHVRLSVRLSVCDVGASGSHRLEILETNCTINQAHTFALRSPKAIHLISWEHGEIWGRLGVGWRAGEQKQQYL